MKKLCLFLFLFCGLTSANSVHAQPLAQLYDQGYDAVDENYYAYDFGQYSFDTSSDCLNNLYYAYDSWVNYGDSDSAALYSYSAYQDFYGSGLVDQGAFDDAYNNGIYMDGDIGSSDSDAWDAAWLSLYAAYDYYYGYIF